ncbi:hypothetical protein R3W88_024066 [Solanum pinnatisectum]|uniref:PB1-like domain-containing protein n=1 Tax=Solanum pinnatisectum TaxID=50273 RepID=A0AAV9LZ88_9SOLN|nr:hypothetical protein R3W88_024066 [Solanum pinnatisectum]
MVLVDLVFHYDGEWIREPKLLYKRKLVHKWEGYDSDLLSFIDITNEYNDKLGYVGVQQLIGDELDVDVDNITKMKESVVVVDEVATDCTFVDGIDNDSDTSTNNSEELEVLAQERKRIIDCSLCDYKDLHRSMTFRI